MAEPRRRVAGWAGVALAVVLVAFVAAFARVKGASWREVVSGALGLFASALAASFVPWLVTGGPLRLEWRPSQDADRPE